MPSPLFPPEQPALLIAVWQSASLGPPYPSPSAELCWQKAEQLLTPRTRCAAGAQGKQPLLGGPQRVIAH